MQNLNANVQPRRQIFIIPSKYSFADDMHPNLQLPKIHLQYTQERRPHTFPQEAVQRTILDANTLQKSGGNALSAESAANALQVLAEFPELATLIETWLSFSYDKKAAILRQANISR